MKMFRKIVNISLWSITIVLVFISLGFSIKQSSQLKCADVKVEITDSIQEKFVRSSDICQWVQRNHKGIFGQPINSVNLRKIEDGLRKIHSIEDVAVYTNVYDNGVKSFGALVVKIKQREPLFRFVGSGRAFYMDKLGKIIEWSPRYTPRVLIVGGVVSPEFARNKLLPLINYINSDTFLSSQIDQIYVNSIGELSMVPRVGEQIILFGEPEDFQIKFRNLKALYSDGFKDGGWSIYKSINLEFRNQIVCTKK
jgi:cell division protein FtsQ